MSVKFKVSGIVTGLIFMPLNYLLLKTYTKTMKHILSLIVAGLLFQMISGQISRVNTMDTICGHPVYRDSNGDILSWCDPYVPGAGYDQVVKLASGFIKSGTPVDPKTGKKLYLVTCCFQGPHIRSQEAFDKGLTGEYWPHNPACVYAGLVQGLVLDYRVYSGDNSYLGIVREMLDWQLEHGTTPDDWPWPNVPYASADPFETEYLGATKWENDGMRGDGLHGIEPDKVGELGIAYLKFYEVTEEEKYLEASIHCADVLAKNVRDISRDSGPFSETTVDKSPWPFRINARTGVIISEYTSNVIESIRLFDELSRIASKIRLENEKTEAYKNARKIAWDWLFSKSGPMKTYIWNGYFEDVPNDPGRANRLQITPLETARYLVKNPGLDPDMGSTVPGLINWVGSAFATEGMDAIKEQTWCYEPMASHTARYASLCALWYEHSGDMNYKDLAYRFFNFATYMTYENGVVAVGPEWPGSWFSDGYGDYIRHYMEGMAAIPEWAPSGEDHLLKCSSVVQQVEYKPGLIRFNTYDYSGTAVLRISFLPKAILAGSKKLTRHTDPGVEGWTWTPLEKGGVLRIRYYGSDEVVISSKPLVYEKLNPPKVLL